MFMSHGAVHEGGQGAASECRFSATRAQDGAVAGGTRSVARVRPVAPSSIPISRGSWSARPPGRDERADGTHHAQAPAKHRACAALVCEAQRLDLRSDRPARSGSVPANSQTTWLRDAQRLAHLKFVSTMRLIGSTTPSSRRRTTFWSLHESVFSVSG